MQMVQHYLQPVVAPYSYLQNYRVVSQDVIHFVKKICIWHQQIIYMSRTSLLQNSAYTKHRTIYNSTIFISYCHSQIHNFVTVLESVHYGLHNPGFNSQQGHEILLYSTMLIPNLGSIQPHSSVDGSDYSTYAFMACIETTLHVPRVFQTVPH